MTKVYSPWGNLPANDNRLPPMIGLTGLRNVGKSTVANMLEKEFGFAKVHAFGSGKEAAREWFIAIGFDAEDAWEMVYGDLKDAPNDYLPNGVAPRYFLERFGHFMGHTMGVEWTLGMEVATARRLRPGKPIVVESVVYEADWFKRAGGKIWRLLRPGHEGPAGIESDAVQATIEADVTIAAHDLDQLRRLVRQEMAGINGVAA